MVKVSDGSLMGCHTSEEKAKAQVRALNAAEDDYSTNRSIPLYPPSSWFTPPEDMPADAGCIVEKNGRIYGYLCHWGSVLMDGSTDRWQPPRSSADYSYAHTGDTVCEDGETVIKTANLGGDFGHAKIGSDDDRVEKLQSFYENTQTQLARVRYGEDEHGVWFAGACWPHVTELDMARLRASARSGHWAAVGDWRDIRSGRAGYELVGACLVNIPGLKYARADRAASGVVLTAMPFARGDFAHEADHAGAMVALSLPDEIASRIAVSYGEAPEYLHVTLAYFDDAAADRDDWPALATALRPVIEGFGGVVGKVSGQGFFDSPEGRVHWLPVDSPDLGRLREAIVDAAEDAGFKVRRDHGFQPHITVSYSDAGSEPPEVELPEGDVEFGWPRLHVGGDVVSLVEQIVEGDMKTDKIAAGGTVALQTAEHVAVEGILVIEGETVEDGRHIKEGATSWRELPLPLYAKLENTGGHNDAQLVGRIDKIWRDEKAQNVVRYNGVLNPDAGEGYGKRVVAAIDSKSLRGVSIDGILGPEDYEAGDDGTGYMNKIVIAGATLTPMPAIGGASVTIQADASREGFAVDDEQVGEEVEAAVSEEVDEGETDAALSEQIASVHDRLEYLIGIVEGAQMSARLEAANRLAEASAVVEGA